MAASITPPTDELNAIIRGDLDILDSYLNNSGNGTGTVHIRSGGLYVEGLADLDQTTINTTDGEFNVIGPNKIEFAISGGATSSIEMTAEDSSFFTTTAGTLTINATATDANGKISLQASGTGSDSIFINASNTTDGQIHLKSDGSSGTIDAIQIISTDNTGGNILIQGNGDFSNSVAAIRIFANNNTSGQILIDSNGGSTTSDAIKLLASDTTDGNILIQAKGDFTASNPAIKLLADNATSGQILIESASDAVSSDSIKLLASGTSGGNIDLTAAGTVSPAINLSATSNTGKILLTSAGGATADNSIEIIATENTDGNILIKGNGTNANLPAIKLLANNSTSGQIFIEASGNIANAIRITADNTTSGGIDIDATGIITIDTTDASNGITIATATTGVPVTIGTSSSLTTIAGNLIVQGTTTTVNSETLTVKDNIILLNSGVGELDMDSGIIVRRYQTPNDAGTGNIANELSPIQESGAFQTGSATPGTLILDQHSSSTDGFYNGWWIKITSGTGVNQIRRIKSYTGSSKTATIYVTADNTSSFQDGLDLTTSPASGDTYEFYSAAFVGNYYNESKERWTFANTSQVPDPLSSTGASVAKIQNYQEINTGAVDVWSQIYKNAGGTASGTTITLTLLGHNLSAYDVIGISDSNDFSPPIDTGKYTILTVPDANTFTINVASTTTNGTSASVTITDYNSSIVKTNIIRPHDPLFGTINIVGISCAEEVVISKTSTSYVFLTHCSKTYGSVMLLVSDLNNSNGAFSCFMGARSAAANSGTMTRLASAKGVDGQRIDADWEDGENIKLRHKPAGTGVGNYTYLARIYFANA